MKGAWLVSSQVTGAIVVVGKDRGISRNYFGRGPPEPETKFIDGRQRIPDQEREIFVNSPPTPDDETGEGLVRTWCEPEAQEGLEWMKILIVWIGSSIVLQVKG